VKEDSIYKTFIEYQEYPNTFPKELTDLWQMKGVCSLKEDLITFKVTGLLIYMNKFFVIFPKAYKIPSTDSEKKYHIEVLINVLLKYKNEATMDPLEMELLGRENGDHTDNLITVYRLIQDFFQNGYLIKEMRVRSGKQCGKIDWPLTINRKQPFFSVSSVVYIDPIITKKIIDGQNLLLKLHKYCLYMGIKKYGWLMGISPDIVEPENNLPNNYDLSFILNFLTNELNSTFVEREIKVIHLIIQYLSGINLKDPKEKIETLATPYFQNVWESMCSVNFNNQYHELKKIIPKLKWEIDSKAPIQPQRPDLMMVREKTLYILDAKYYNVDKSLPGWSDIVKQLFYAFTIYKNIQSCRPLLNLKLNNINNVFNAFLFPSSDSEAIKYIGKVEIEGNEQLGSVKSFKLNTFLMMKCYIGVEKLIYLNEFIKVIKHT